MTRFDPTIHKVGAQSRSRGGYSGGGATTGLSGVDWVIVLLCPGIGFIVGLVRLIGGGGATMLIASVIAQVAYGILALVLSHAR